MSDLEKFEEPDTFGSGVNPLDYTYGVLGALLSVGAVETLLGGVPGSWYLLIGLIGAFVATIQEVM
jgi:hypothetical protein